MEIYLVGGAVRDKLLGLPVGERDWVVVGATPQQMLDQGFRQVGKDFPVFLHPDTHEEYALARTERKIGPGYKGFEVHAAPDVTLEQDLRRRDLTINAIAEDAHGQIIDPCDGQTDLRLGRLRHISPAFAEDPVRILRVARFAARFAHWGFRVAHGTHKLMRDMVAAGEVDALVPERVWAETERALGEASPSRFFEVLHKCGALARVYPEIDAMFSAADAQAHDAGPAPALAGLRRAVQLSNDSVVRFAALVAGLGQRPNQSTAHARPQPTAGIALIEGLCRRLRVPNDYRDVAVLTAGYHTQVDRAPALGAAERLELLEHLDAFRRGERFERVLIACQAAAQGEHQSQDAPNPAADVLRQALQAAQAVSPQPLVAAGLKNQALADELRRQRIAAIQAVADTPPTPDR